MLKTVKLIILALIIPLSSFAQEIGPVTGLPMPRFVTLKSNQTNLRKGPNTKYAITWTYKKKGYPLEVVAEFENWRKLQDIDGSEGWVHENLITGARNVVIIANNYTIPISYPKVQNEVILFRYPDETSYPMLRAEIGVLGSIKNCETSWCKIRIEDTTGWIRKENLWGVYKEELIK